MKQQNFNARNKIQKNLLHCCLYKYKAQSNIFHFICCFVYFIFITNSITKIGTRRVMQYLLLPCKYSPLYENCYKAIFLNIPPGCPLVLNLDLGRTAWIAKFQCQTPYVRYVYRRRPFFT